MATHPPLADPARFAKRIGKTALSDEDLEVLRAASNRFRGDVRHPVHEIVDDEIMLDGDGGRTLLLPATPVTAVTTVEIDGVAASIGDEVRWSRAGILSRRGGFPDEFQAVRVVYTHGYSVEWTTVDSALQRRLVPEDIQEHVMNLAQYLIETPLAVQSKTVGAQTVTWSAAAVTAEVTEGYLRCVDAYKLNQGDDA